MSTLFPHNIQVERSGGSYSGGRWVPGLSQLVAIVGSVQPVTGKDTEFLPENRRDTGLVKVYSNEPLQVSIEGGDSRGDVVIWAGKRWEVVQELVFANGLIDHYKYLAAYVGPQVSQETAQQATETQVGV